MTNINYVKKLSWAKLLLALSIVAVVVLLLPSAPMGKEKAARYLTLIAAHEHQPGGQHDMAALTRFFQQDDGKPFYTVNLYKYHEKAQYLDSIEHSISGVQAYDSFSQVMVPLLLQNFAYPIFASNWLDFSDKKWDRIVIVRYPNREAMAKIFASEAFSKASAHKWASIAQHDRFIVQATHLPELIVLVLLVILLTSTYLITRRLYR